MKKIFIIFVFFISLQIHSQKSVEIYNFSTYTVRINTILTKPLTTNYPWCASVSPNFIEILPGDSYFIENATNQFRFPFFSPNSSPQITNWRRVLAPAVPGGNSNWSNISSNAAWLLGNSQFFNYLNLSVFNGSSFFGSCDIGLIQPYFMSTFGWESFYDNFSSGNTIIDTVLIM